MTKTERRMLAEYANNAPLEELEEVYHSAVADSLGSETEAMYELGYDMADIKEREQLEKYYIERADILENSRIKRGVKLWEN